MTLAHRLAFLASILFFHYYRVFFLTKVRNLPVYAFLTQWAFFITTASALLNLYCSLTSNASASILKVARYLISIGFTLQVIVVVFYFPLVHPKVPLFYKDPSDLMFLFWVHLIPFAGMLLDVLNSKMIFRKSDLKLTIPILVLYACVNYHFTMKLGSPIYPLVTWKDYTTAFLVLAVLIAVTSIQCCLAALTAGRRKLSLTKTD